MVEEFAVPKTEEGIAPLVMIWTLDEFAEKVQNYYHSLIERFPGKERIITNLFVELAQNRFHYTCVRRINISLPCWHDFLNEHPLFTGGYACSHRRLAVQKSAYGLRF